MTEGTYSLVGEYIRSSDKVMFQHNSCGNVFAMRPRNFNTGQRCPKCAPVSYCARAVENYLVESSIPYVKEVTFPDLIDKRMLQFDFGIYSPNGELLFLIEVDGKQHFGLGYTDGYEITKKHDGMKNEYCKWNQIYLLRIKYITPKDIERGISELYKSKSLFTYDEYHNPNKLRSALAELACKLL
jgi:hypothetical protein